MLLVSNVHCIAELRWTQLEMQRTGMLSLSSGQRDRGKDLGKDVLVILTRSVVLKPKAHSSDSRNSQLNPIEVKACQLVKAMYVNYPQVVPDRDGREIVFQDGAFVCKSVKT